MNEQLRASWSSDLAVLAPEAGAGLPQAELTLLESQYAAPHRSYHTLRHVEEMITALARLQQAGELDAAGTQARVARVACWYHDVVYDPRAEAGSNEYRSAAVARDHLHHLGVAASIIDEVESLVLLSATHDGGVGQSAAAFHDADLWILSSAPQRYAGYTAQVRREYHHVPDARFAAGRSAILRSFAERTQIYRTSYAQARWTATARANLAGELEQLGA